MLCEIESLTEWVSTDPVGDFYIDEYIAVNTTKLIKYTMLPLRYNVFVDAFILNTLQYNLLHRHINTVENIP